MVLALAWVLSFGARHDGPSSSPACSRTLRLLRTSAKGAAAFVGLGFGGIRSALK
jgi:hypothetical protein